MAALAHGSSKCSGFYWKQMVYADYTLTRADLEDANNG
jgi:hypothetical protein